MTDVQKEDSKKTIVAFVVGLLIGGLLVWAFIGENRAEAPGVENEITNEETTDETQSGETTTKPEAPVAETQVTSSPALTVGEGAIVVNNQTASRQIAMVSATYPIAEGWIGVRDYTNGNLGGILGVVRFSESQGLVPNEIILQRPTRAGNTYAVVIFSDDGDRQFNSAGDVQIDQIFTTFTAQ